MSDKYNSSEIIRFKLKPKDWLIKNFVDVATLQRGKDLPLDIRSPGSYPVIGSNGVAGYHSEFVSKGPGVLVGWSGSVGKVTFIETNFWPLNTTLWVRDFHENDPTFIYYFLSHFDFARYSAGVSVPTLNRNLVHPIKVCIPPLPEQRAIARALRAVQGAREARLHEVALEKERKAALMEHLFTKGTRGEATKQTEIGEMPGSWDSIQLESVCIKIVDCPHSTPHFSSQGFLVARNFNIRCGKLDLTSSFFTIEDEYNERIKRCKPIEGDILFSREAPVGEACLIPPNIELCLGQRMMLLRVDPLIMNNFFLVQTFYTKSIRSIMTANSSGVTAKHLNVADVKRLKIPYPSIEEQNYISTILDACDSKIAALEHEARLHDELFRAMLEELMSGRLRRGRW